MAGRGGTVDLGTKVTTTDPNDLVTVHITGLPKYESITDKLDGRTFRGNDITLTAAQVDSGLDADLDLQGRGSSGCDTYADGKCEGSVNRCGCDGFAANHHRDGSSTRDDHDHDHDNLVAPPPPPRRLISPLPPRPAATPTTVADEPSLRDHHQQTAAPHARGGLGEPGLCAAPAAFGTRPPAPWQRPAAAADQCGRSSGRDRLPRMASVASQSFALLNQYLAGSHRPVSIPVRSWRLCRKRPVRARSSLLARPQH